MSEAPFRAALTTRRFGRVCRWLAETGSTNHDALAWAAQEAPDGAVVTADAQTAGRGRLSRVWFSPPGKNLYVSLILRPGIEDPARLATLPLIAGFALAEALAARLPTCRPRIKWPNDLWLGDKKCCGILCEMQTQGNAMPAVVAGFGMNVNLTRDELAQELRDTATSLAIETGETFSRPRLLAAILNTFEPIYDRWREEGLAPFLPRLRERDALRGEPVTLALLGKPLSGIAEGIAPDGALLLRLPDGTQTPVYSGEATRIRRS
ncbi:MAG: biotin--[acetyl-CoA-carboxylase] ligase [Kiritimatiellae bacterium]|nr:biotin--[acetyl-CoA-carboxylase] ligase [Kiritimatiellia bacterium]